MTYLKTIIENWEIVITMIFAFMSVIFAGLSFWFSFLEYQRNNPKVIYYAHFGFTFSRIKNQKSRKILDLKIQNVGRRPIAINNHYFFKTKLFSKGNSYLVIPDNPSYIESPPNLPCILNEGESLSIKYWVDYLKKGFNEKIGLPNYFIWEDMHKKRYKAKISLKDWDI